MDGNIVPTSFLQPDNVLNLFLSLSSSRKTANFLVLSETFPKCSKWMMDSEELFVSKWKISE